MFLLDSSWILLKARFSLFVKCCHPVASKVYYHTISVFGTLTNDVGNSAHYQPIIS